MVITDKKSKILFTGMAFLILFAVWATYYKTYVSHNFEIIIEEEGEF